MRYKPNFLRRVALLALVFILTFMILTVFSAATPWTQVSASTISWSSPTAVSGGMLNVVSLIRPSDGTFFFIGDSGNTPPPGNQGGSVGGIFIRTNASSFAGGSGSNFATAFRVTNDQRERKPSAVFDRNSNLHIVWSDSSVKFHYVRFDATGQLVDQQDIGNITCGNSQCINPTIATSLSPTRPVELKLAYNYVQPTAGVTQYAMGSNDGGATWSTGVPFSNLFLSNQVKANKIALAPDGTVYAAFWQADGVGGWTDNLYVARKPLNASWDTPILITTNTWGKEFGLTTDSASNAYLIFNGGCATGERFFVSRYSGGSWSSPTGINSCSSDGTKSINLTNTPDGAVWGAISIANVGMRYLHSADGLAWTYGDAWTANTPGGIGSSISAWNTQVLIGAEQSATASIGFVTLLGSVPVPTATPSSVTNTPVPTNTIGATNTPTVGATPTNTGTIGATNTPAPTNTVGSATSTPVVPPTPTNTGTIGATVTPGPPNTATATSNTGPALTYYAQATATVFAGNAQATATAISYYATVTARNQNATITAAAAAPTPTPWVADSTTPGRLSTPTPYPLPNTPVRFPTAASRTASPTPSPLPGAAAAGPSLPTPFPTATPLPALGVFGSNPNNNSAVASAGNVPALGLALPTATPTATPLPTATPQPTATAVVIVADTGDANGVLRLIVADSDEGIVPLLVRGLISLMITALLYLGWRFIRPQVYVSGRRL